MQPRWYDNLLQMAKAAEQVQESLAPMRRSFEQIASFATHLEVSLAPILESLELFGASIDIDQVVRAITELERYAGDQRVEDAFIFVDFIPSPSVDKDLVDRVTEAHETGEPRERIESLILASFDADNSDSVACIVEKLLKMPEFSDRREVLNDVLAAHRAGLDAITTYPLVCMVEGVLISAIEPSVTDKKKELRHNKLKDHMETMPVSIARSVGFEAVSSMLAFMEGSLYHSAYWWDDEELRTNYIELNRHRLLHGMAPRGTRLNTLRCITMLDLIGSIFEAQRQKTTSDRVIAAADK